MLPSPSPSGQKTRRQAGGGGSSRDPSAVLCFSLGPLQKIFPFPAQCSIRIVQLVVACQAHADKVPVLQGILRIIFKRKDVMDDRRLPLLPVSSCNLIRIAVTPQNRIPLVLPGFALVKSVVCFQGIIKPRLPPRFSIISHIICSEELPYKINQPADTLRCNPHIGHESEVYTCKYNDHYPDNVRSHNKGNQQ